MTGRALCVIGGGGRAHPNRKERDEDGAPGFGLDGGVGGWKGFWCCGGCGVGRVLRFALDDGFVGLDGGVGGLDGGVGGGRTHPNRKERDEDGAPGWFGWRGWWVEGFLVLWWLRGWWLAEPTLIAKCAMRIGHPVWFGWWGWWWPSPP